MSARLDVDEEFAESEPTRKINNVRLNMGDFPRTLDQG